MNDDGIPDAVIGKRWDGWGKNSKDPNYLYCYQLTPGAKNPWKRHCISYNEKVGIGTGGQVLDYDFNGDLDLIGSTRENGIYVVENTTQTTPNTRWLKMLDQGSLKGWKAFGNKANSLWIAQNQEIHSNANQQKNVGQNWLRFNTELDDFEFECEFFSSDHTGNTGIQVRSRYIKNVMRGPQIDIHPAAGWRSGLIYDETQGCWIQPKKSHWKIDQKDGPSYWQWYKNGWNRMRIRCQGSKISTWVNGIHIATYDDAKHGYLNQPRHHEMNVAKKGYIFLQQHSNSKLNIKFRKLRYRELTKAE